MYIVKAYMGSKMGWKEIKRFASPADADNWVTAYVKSNGYSITDFTIKFVA